MGVRRTVKIEVTIHEYVPPSQQRPPNAVELRKVRGAPSLNPHLDLLIIYLVQVRDYAAALYRAIGLKVNGPKNRWAESMRLQCLP